MSSSTAYPLNQLIAYTTRTLNLRLLIALLLGLFLVLGVHAEQIMAAESDRSADGTEAWPVRCSSKK